MIIVEHDHGPRYPYSVHHFIRCEHALRRIESADGVMIGSADTIAPPVRTGGEHDAGDAQFQHLTGGNAAGAQHLHVLHFIQLIQPIIPDARPSRESRQP